MAQTLAPEEAARKHAMPPARGDDSGAVGLIRDRSRVHSAQQTLLYSRLRCDGDILAHVLVTP